VCACAHSSVYSRFALLPMMDSRLIKRRKSKALLRMHIRITTQRNKVTVPFSAPDRLYRFQSITLCEQYAGALDSRVSYSEDLLNYHTIVHVLRLLSHSRVVAQQPAHIPKDRLPSHTMTPSIILSCKKQYSSCASAEAVVPTQEYPLNHHVIRLVPRTHEYRLALFLINYLLRQRYLE
jgi:hypothetical protein